MNSGYNVESLSDALNGLDGVGVSYDDLYEEGEKYLTGLKSSNGMTEFANFILQDGALDGGKLKEDFFPLYDFDIFISHSHKDISDVTALVGLLHRYGIRAFVDSYVWNSVYDLQSKLNKRHSLWKKVNGCINCELYGLCNEEQCTMYSHEEANSVAAHVYAMLSIALFEVMTKSPYMMFISTPKSLDRRNVTERTDSSWIFQELSFAKSLLWTREEALREALSMDSMKKSIESSAQRFSRIEHDVDTSCLTDVTGEDLKKWYRSLNGKKGIAALQKLDAIIQEAG